MTASQMNTSEKMNASTVCQVYTVPTKANYTYLRNPEANLLNVLVFFNVAGVFKRLKLLWGVGEKGVVRLY